MTWEEAIEAFEEIKANAQNHLGKKYAAGCDGYYRNIIELAGVALSALRPVSREQVAEVWKGCDLCLDDSWQRILMIPKRVDHTNMLSTELAQFCPGCGRPLTDKAVDMVMERLEALKDGPEQ